MVQVRADLTEYKVAVRSVAPERELPSDQDLKRRLLHVPPVAGGEVLDRPVTSALRVEPNGRVRPKADPWSSCERATREPASAPDRLRGAGGRVTASAPLSLE